jgi:hypothetical protein
MKSVPFDSSGDAPHGAHRLRLVGTGSADAWSDATAALSARIADHRYWSAWRLSSLLEVVGAEVGREGATVYMAGSIDEWRALTAARIRIPAIDAAARSLSASGGRLERASCQSRRFDIPDFSTPITTWPWPIRASSWEITTVRPLGTISRCQLDMLATALMAAVHAVSDRYGEGRAVATVVDDRVQLVESVPTDGVLQMICVWYQLCWVDLLGVDLD